MIASAIKVSSKGGHEICGLLIDNRYFLECLEVKNKKSRGEASPFMCKKLIELKKQCQCLIIP
jgi:hypothetical protein